MCMHVHSCNACSNVRVSFGLTGGRILGMVSSVRWLNAAAAITPMGGGASGGRDVGPEGSAPIHAPPSGLSIP